ncbi:MAG: Ig-like domain-containing protein, partial [Micropruina glycogenica]
ASVTTAKPSAATATRSRTRVTLTATVKSQVAGVMPKGSVRFYLDGVRVGDVVLGSAKQGVAAFRYPTIATAGSHRLTARYRGDARVTASYESVIIIVKG